MSRVGWVVGRYVGRYCCMAAGSTVVVEWIATAKFSSCVGENE